MRAIEIISEKRDGGVLSEAQIRFMIDGYVDGSIPEYQVSALLMAIFFRGMDERETSILTQAMIDSGEVMDLTSLSQHSLGTLVDKHSTGGVGDKVSLILAPIVAAAGGQVPMMSGRGLGHTGGTLDKLESIPGYRTDLTNERFADIIARCGYAMTGQSADIVPADKKLYALRDVTATVESIPLITASILSKKFAEGAQNLVFDVKYGNGAFMKTLDDARALAASLVRVGNELGRGVTALISAMDVPLGSMIGNFLEVEESIACLEGRGWEARFEDGALRVTGASADLMEITLHLACHMLLMAKLADSEQAAMRKALDVLADGSAARHFWQNVELQGGRKADALKLIGDRSGLHSVEIGAPSSGILTGLDAYRLGLASVVLGAGRNVATDSVLPDVGIQIHRKPGSRLEKGEGILTLFARTEQAARDAQAYITQAIEMDGASFQNQGIVRQVIR